MAANKEMNARRDLLLRRTGRGLEVRCASGHLVGVFTSGHRYEVKCKCGRFVVLEGVLDQPSPRERGGGETQEDH